MGIGKVKKDKQNKMKRKQPSGKKNKSRNHRAQLELA